MVAMTRVPWATLESVGDQSEYDCVPLLIFVMCALKLMKKRWCPKVLRAADIIDVEANMGYRLYNLQKPESCSLVLMGN
uniref:Uncharacterized protein n=1 Tax=Arundo donax TaxID=35708 RepID=A0A0A9DCM5_ARUDO